MSSLSEQSSRGLVRARRSLIFFRQALSEFETYIPEEGSAGGASASAGAAKPRGRLVPANAALAILPRPRRLTLGRAGGRVKSAARGGTLAAGRPPAAARAAGTMEVRG